jgi:superfamily I DNA/RNA helicase
VRFKVVPEPRSLSFVRDAQQALPLVPSSESDCCALLMADTAIDNRATAREWITFLRALRLVGESDGRYYQRQEDPSGSDLAEAFRERVYAADEVLTVLEGHTTEDEPLSVTEVFEHIREIVPVWEQNHHDDWETVWRERVNRLLEWTVEFGLAERSGGGFRV